MACIHVIFVEKIPIRNTLETLENHFSVMIGYGKNNPVQSYAIGAAGFRGLLLNILCSIKYNLKYYIK